MEYLFNKPITMPRGSHYGSDYWVSYSYKLQRNVQFYSMLEYANFVFLEMNPSVEYFCEQPLKIEHPMPGKKSIVFDFWVLFFDGATQFQEVKYSNEILGSDEKSLRSQKQIEAEKLWCMSQKYDFRVVTEKELLKDQHYFNNINKLRHTLCRSSADSISYTKAFFDALKNVPNKTIGEIINSQLVPSHIVWEILSNQFYLGNIDLDILGRPLDYSTGVYYGRKKI